jgi:putative glycosyltransferase
MKISIVATLYFSENFINEFYLRLVNTIKPYFNSYEIIFVDDGSPDSSKDKVLALQTTDANITLVELSRNFGHHKAIMTGLNFAKGDFVFLIDTDLEEEPELFLKFWEEINKNKDYDVVYGVQHKRKGKFFERISGWFFYKLFHFIAGFQYPKDTLTSRLMSKKYIEGLKGFKETEIDVWGIFILTGFKQKGIIVTKNSKGTTTYTFIKKMKLALNSITSLTSRPLYLIFLAGLLISAVSFLTVLFLFYRKFIHNELIDEWTAILVSIWLIGGIIMLTLGVIGIYLSRIFIEVKNRPLSVIKNIYKIDKP